MKQWKKRLVVFLCTILVAPTVMQALPMRSMSQVQAAGNAWLQSNLYTEYDVSTQKSKISPVTVEVGEKIDLGYYFHYYNNSNGRGRSGILADLKKGVSYTGSNSKVVAVNKKSGRLTPKKVGTATVKIKYAGSVTKVPIKVVKKGSLNLSSYNKYNKLAKELLKVNYKKTNAKNEYTVMKKLVAYEQSYAGYYDGESPVNYMGMKMEKNVQEFSGPSQVSYMAKNVIVAPLMAKATEHSYKVRNYFVDRNPVGTNPSKYFKVKRVSTPKAGAKSFTITLKKKVTASQVCALKALVSHENSYKKDGKAKFTINIYDVKKNNYFTGLASVKQGSNKITVTIKKETSKDPNAPKPKTKFTRGKYKIGTEGTWLKPKTLNVK